MNIVYKEKSLLTLGFQSKNDKSFFIKGKSYVVMRYRDFRRRNDIRPIIGASVGESTDLKPQEGAVFLFLLDSGAKGAKLEKKVKGYCSKSTNKSICELTKIKFNLDDADETAAMVVEAIVEKQNALKSLVDDLFKVE